MPYCTGAAESAGGFCVGTHTSGSVRQVRLQRPHRPRADAGRRGHPPPAEDPPRFRFHGGRLGHGRFGAGRFRRRVGIGGALGIVGLLTFAADRVRGRVGPVLRLALLLLRRRRDRLWRGWGRLRRRGRGRRRGRRRLRPRRRWRWQVDHLHLPGRVCCALGLGLRLSAGGRVVRNSSEQDHRGVRRGAGGERGPGTADAGCGRGQLLSQVVTFYSTADGRHTAFHPRAPQQLLHSIPLLMQHQNQQIPGRAQSSASSTAGSSPGEVAIAASGSPARRSSSAMIPGTSPRARPRR